MKKSRYTESQIVKILKEIEAGVKVADVCREYGISNATDYNGGKIRRHGQIAYQPI
ncbi:transposase [Vibrio splendidus]|uniref:transposase n=1 Tax=Vibrio splendidus TaxID=29497 RepID=UPI0015E6F898